MLLQATNLVKEYGQRGEVVRVVDGVSLEIARGETLGLVGESGSGKSTVARMVLRLIEPTTGEVRFDGTDLLRATPHELRSLRRRMQIVFQDPYGALNPRMRVREILAEPFAIHKTVDDRCIDRCSNGWWRCWMRWGWRPTRWGGIRMSSAGGNGRGSRKHCAGAGAAAGVAGAG